jgi:hypothetical protein
LGLDQDGAVEVISDASGADVAAQPEERREEVGKRSGWMQRKVKFWRK